MTDTRPIVLCDQDGILAALHSRVAERFSCQFYAKPPFLTALNFSNYSPSRGLEAPGFSRIDISDIVKGYLAEEYFYLHLGVVMGAVEGVRAIQESGARVIILSSYGDAPNCVPDKCKWLDYHFPFLDKYDRIFTGNKSLVRGDCMIDDSPQHLAEWSKLNPEGVTCTFKLPYTKESDADVFASDWPDLVSKWQAYTAFCNTDSPDPGLTGPFHLG